MKTNFAPGSWTVKSIFPDATQGHTFEPRVWISSTYPGLGDCRIADIPDVVSPDCEEMATATLMAAAPDLFAALCELNAFAKRQGWTHVAIQQADAAIAKAEGFLTLEDLITEGI